MGVAAAARRCYCDVDVGLAAQACVVSWLFVSPPSLARAGLVSLFSHAGRFSLCPRARVVGAGVLRALSAHWPRRTCLCLVRMPSALSHVRARLLPLCARRTRARLASALLCEPGDDVRGRRGRRREEELGRGTCGLRGPASPLTKPASNRKPTKPTAPKLLYYEHAFQSHVLHFSRMYCIFRFMC